MAAKNPSPNPASGAPRAMLPKSSSAEDATHHSLALAFPIDAVSLGNACFTVTSYTPGTFALAMETNTSLRIDKKIGSKLMASGQAKQLIKMRTQRTFDILRPDVQKCGCERPS